MLLCLPFAFAATLPGPVTETTLGNGLALMVVELDGPGVVALQTWVDVGSRDESEPGTTGYAHFLEHLLFLGSENVDADTRDAMLMDLGARENAWTSEDFTVYHLVLPADGLDEVLVQEADRMQRLVLTEQGVKQEAGAVLGEWRRYQNMPAVRLDEAVYAAAFPTHGYGHGTIGLEEDVRAMPEGVDAVQRFYDRHYRPERVRVVVAGDVDAAAIAAQVEDAFGGWERGEDRPPELVEAARTERLVLDVPTDDEARWGLVGWVVPGMDPADPDAAALAVVTELLFGEVAELREELERERRLVHSLDGPWGTKSRPHLLAATTELREGVSREDVEAAVIAAAEALRDIDDALVASTRDHLVKRLLLSLDHPEAIAETLGWLGGSEALDSWVAALQAVDAETVSRFAETWLVEEHLVVGRLEAGE